MVNLLCFSPELGRYSLWGLDANQFAAAVRSPFYSDVALCHPERLGQYRDQTRICSAPHRRGLDPDPQTSWFRGPDLVPTGPGLCINIEQQGVAVPATQRGLHTISMSREPWSSNGSTINSRVRLRNTITRMGEKSMPPKGGRMRRAGDMMGSVRLSSSPSTGL